MMKRIAAIVTLACFVVYLHGCYSSEEISIHELLSGSREAIESVVTVDGTAYSFKTASEPGILRAMILDSTIVGTLSDGTYKRIPLSEVKLVYVEKFDVGRTIAAAIVVPVLIGGIAIAIIAATKESCPFVYSFNGERFVFDGEPYGGAICEALQRTDWCRLEHLKPVNGKYRLLLTNEVDETQYTDEFKLWVVDHSPSVNIVPDASGRLYSVGHPQEPFSATDNHGHNLRHWLSDKDLLVWESDMGSKDSSRASDLRDTIYLSFPRPPHLEQTKLVINGGTTLWGSQMLKRMTELRGDQVGQWYQDLKSPMVRTLLDGWDMREELYHLQVRVLIDGSWVTRGDIIGGGPFITEDRIVPLDLRGVQGDTLKLMIAPPAGFWQLNSFAVDYSPEEPLEFQEISATSIVGDDGTDLREMLGSTDSKYYIMPKTGQSARLTFAAPALKTGSERAIFACVSGYYDMHMNARGPANVSMLTRISFEPGYPIRFAIQQYHEWVEQELKASQMSKRGSQ